MTRPRAVEAVEKKFLQDAAKRGPQMGREVMVREAVSTPNCLGTSTEAFHVRLMDFVRCSCVSSTCVWDFRGFSPFSPSSEWILEDVHFRSGHSRSGPVLSCTARRDVRDGMADSSRGRGETSHMEWDLESSVRKCCADSNVVVLRRWADGETFHMGWNLESGIASTKMAVSRGTSSSRSPATARWVAAGPPCTTARPPPTY